MVIKTTKTDTDQLARALGQLGAMASAMPPAWRGAGISHPLLSPEGGALGQVLPGRGIYLAADLKSLGIQRKLPGVIDFTNFWRAAERVWRDERGALLSNDDINVSRFYNMSDDITVYKGVPGTGTSAFWVSLYAHPGIPGVGSFTSIPGGAVHTQYSPGAWSFAMHEVTGGDRKYLVSLGFGSTPASNSQPISTLVLIDLLVAAGGIQANTAAAQTVNTVALTRYTSGAGVMATFEITTQLGAATNLGMTYTNQAGTPGCVSPVNSNITTNIVRALTPITIGPFMQLIPGDYGVRAVQDVTFSGGVTTGAVALLLYYPLAFFPGAKQYFIERDLNKGIEGLVEIANVNGVLGCVTGIAWMGGGVGNSPDLLCQLRTVDS